MLSPRPPQRFSLYDLPIAISSDVGSLDAEIARLLGPFALRDAEFTGRGQPTAGVIRPYDQAEVLRHLSPRARRVATPEASSAELYEDGERFWRIDDGCGIVEINLLKSQWRAWMLPASRGADAVRRAETAVLWPLAQLLRARGLHLLPAASVVRNGFGLLLLSPFPLGAELAAMLRAGCRVVGQRWTIVREWGGHVEMLHLPGVIERPVPQRLRPAGDARRAARVAAGGSDENWIDLAREHCGVELSHAPCTGVFVVSPGRRPTAHLRRLDGAEAIDALRGGWPIEQLHPLRRHGQMPAKLAGRCACYEVALSRDPHEMLALMGALPQRGIGAANLRPRVQVTIHASAAARRSAVAV